MTSEQTDNSDVFQDLNSLARLRQRPVILLDGPMDEFLAGWGSFIAPAISEERRLSVLLNSPGGSATATYRMMLSLRNHVDDIEVLVPHWAKSAATLFCLGADAIYMGKEGELGPLDPQVLEGTGNSSRISSLESFKALERLFDYSLETFDGIVEWLLEKSYMDVPNAMDRATPLFSAIVSPLYRQIDPHELGKSGMFLAEIEEYAIRAMQRWGYKDEDEDKVLGTVRSLVWDYPSHSFIIDLQEAKELGLNVSELDDDSESLCEEILSHDDAQDILPVPFGLPTVATEQDDSNCNLKGEDGNNG